MSQAYVGNGSGGSGGVDLHVARYIVSPGGHTDGANYTTIASGYAAAVTAGAPQTVFVQDGTYNETLTLTPGIDIVSFTADAYEPNVIINGSVTLTGSGTVSISGVEFQTNSNYAINVTGSSASVLNLINCNTNCLNHTGIQFTSSSSNAQISLTNCLGNLGTTGIGLFSHSSAGTLQIDSSYFTNTGGSTTASTCSSGVFNSSWSQFDFPLSLTSTSGTTFEHVSVYTSAQNVTSATFNGSTHSSKYCTYSSGTASAVSIGSAHCMLDFCAIATSNNNAITGSGTIYYGLLDFLSTSSNINTTTQSAVQSRGGGLGLNGTYTNPKQPSFLVYLSTSVPDATGNGANYQVAFDTKAFDIGGNFTTGASAVFTAPVTGKYYLSAIADCYMNSNTDANVVVSIIATSRSIQGQIYTGAAALSGGMVAVPVSGIIDMTAGDTAYVNVNISSTGANTCQINGSGSPYETYFSGYLVG